MEQSSLPIDMNSMNSWAESLVGYSDSASAAYVEVGRQQISVHVK